MRHILFPTFFLSATLMIALFACKNTASPAVNFEALDDAAKNDAANAVASMEMAAGLEVTLFAAEPTLVNPTNLHVDHRGRVWVIEGYNYRNGLNPENPYRKEGDRILILEDTNGDGISDQSKVYYQGEDINAALGIFVMGNKVIVSHSPHIFVFTDTDGDDLPDQRDTLFSGIQGDQDDHGVHAFSFGPDGRLYFNMGNAGKTLFDKNGKPVLDPLGRPIETTGKPYRQGLALRCNIDGSGVEVLGHNFRNPYELAVDSYGTVWQSDNDDDGNKGVRVNYVMQNGSFGYTDEMTGAGWRAVRNNMEPEIPLQHWHLNDPGSVPNVLQTGSGSPTGILVYEGNLLPEIFHNQLIHSEAGHSVVRSYTISPDGAGYKGDIVNIMQSKNQWSRPSDVCVAPDGSLIASDWFDPGVGGHKVDDLDRGRIFRIAPKGVKYEQPKWSVETPEAAVEALQNPNLSVRYLAWNALADAGNQAEPALVSLWKNGASRMRARALWLLARLPEKAGSYIQEALADSDVNIRITGIRVAAQLSPESLMAYLEKIKNDPAPAVRREILLQLRTPVGGNPATLWAEMAGQYDGKDRWYLEALGIAAALQEDVYFQAWLNKVGDQWNTTAGRDIIWRSRSSLALPYLESILADANTPAADLPKFFRALHFHYDAYRNAIAGKFLQMKDHPHAKEAHLAALLELDAKAIRTPELKKAVVQTVNEIEDKSLWLNMVRNLELKENNPKLLDIAVNGKDNGYAREALSTLLQLGGINLVQQHIKTLTPEAETAWIQKCRGIQHEALLGYLEQIIFNENKPLAARRAAVESLGGSWQGAHNLDKLLMAGKLPAAFKNTALLQMANAWDPQLRTRAAEMLAASSADGGINPADLANLLRKSGHAANGLPVFEQYCATCHVVNGKGEKFGPDLSEIGSKLAKKALYTSIFYPSSGINFGYEGYLIKTKNGEVYNGILDSKTSDELTIRMVGGASKTIPVGEIESQEELPASLMTDGLYKVMKEQELVDLVEYLSSLKKPETSGAIGQR